jgi:bis(5'-nucleosyl)-tetraphosphatase (symmetrical)
MEKIIVAVGDVHGCIEELDELLKTIQYNPSQMRLVFLGDLVDRGPDSVACVRRVRELGAECIMGNHEEKQIRWYKHEMNRLMTGKANPMKPLAPADAAANAALSDDDWTWLTALPVKLHIGDNWWAVHAGCEPKFTLERQNKSQIMRVRYVDERGTGKALGPNLSQPEGTQYWDQLWKGPESIIYGHCVHDLKYPRITNVSLDVSCVGIDTGCVFGGHLTAALFQREFPQEGGGVAKYDRFRIQYVQVPAKQKYFAGYGDE